MSEPLTEEEAAYLVSRGVRVFWQTHQHPFKQSVLPPRGSALRVVGYSFVNRQRDNPAVFVHTDYVAPRKRPKKKGSPRGKAK